MSTTQTLGSFALITKDLVIKAPYDNVIPLTYTNTNTTLDCFTINNSTSFTCELPGSYKFKTVMYVTNLQKTPSDVKLIIEVNNADTARLSFSVPASTSDGLSSSVKCIGDMVCSLRKTDVVSVKFTSSASKLEINRLELTLTEEKGATNVQIKAKTLNWEPVIGVRINPKSVDISGGEFTLTTFAVEKTQHHFTLSIKTKTDSHTFQHAIPVDGHASKPELCVYMNDTRIPNLDDCHALIINKTYKDMKVEPKLLGRENGNVVWGTLIMLVPVAFEQIVVTITQTAREGHIPRFYIATPRAMTPFVEVLGANDIELPTLYHPFKGTIVRENAGDGISTTKTPANVAEIAHHFNGNKCIFLHYNALNVRLIFDDKTTLLYSLDSRSNINDMLANPTNQVRNIPSPATLTTAIYVDGIVVNRDEIQILWDKHLGGVTFVTADIASAVISQDTSCTISHNATIVFKEFTVNIITDEIIATPYGAYTKK